MRFAAVVAFAIKLNDELGLRTIEVDNVRFDGMLAAELQASKLAAAEDRPEQLLRMRRLLAQIDRSIAGDLCDAFQRAHAHVVACGVVNPSPRPSLRGRGILGEAVFYGPGAGSPGDRSYLLPLPPLRGPFFLPGFFGPCGSPPPRRLWPVGAGPLDLPMRPISRKSSCRRSTSTAATATRT